MMKSLRRQGSWVTSEAARKFASEPEKNSSSVRTESAAAPACSNSRARAAESKLLRISPRDGDLFFSSATTAIPNLLPDSSLLRKPRGMCDSACRSSSLKFAFERHSRTLRRAAAIMSANMVMLNLLIIRDGAGSHMGTLDTHLLTGHLWSFRATSAAKNLQFLAKCRFLRPGGS